MHLGSIDVDRGLERAAPIREQRNLDFLWLELTNRCNLRCVHCYTDSHPHSGDRDRLTTRDYESVLEQAYELGCRKMQFIGGEPQLNRDFLPLLVEAKNIGFDFIEVFSNLTRLDDDTTRYAADNGICFATSVYSDEPAAHDAITQVGSSHARTIGNLKKLIDHGVETRAAMIVLDQDAAAVGRTTRFLRDMGVRDVRVSETREFGRGQAILAKRAQLSGLCGHCWAGKLCVAPEGAAYPCVMARDWPVGNVLESSLAEIVRGERLDDMRREIFDAVWLPKVSAAGNGRQRSAAPKNYPPGEKRPGKRPEPTLPEAEPPDEPAPACLPSCSPCPQSCNPDISTCGPMSCPQSCLPNRVE